MGGIAEKSAVQLLGELLVLPEDMSVREWVAHAGLGRGSIIAQEDPSSEGHASPKRAICASDVRSSCQHRWPSDANRTFEPSIQEARRRAREGENGCHCCGHVQALACYLWYALDTTETSRARSSTVSLKKQPQPLDIQEGV